MRRGLNFWPMLQGLSSRLLLSIPMDEIALAGNLKCLIVKFTGSVDKTNFEASIDIDCKRIPQFFGFKGHLNIYIYLYIYHARSDRRRRVVKLVHQDNVLQCQKQLHLYICCVHNKIIRS
ncbi:hypothetical protein ES332_D01G085600v1 [Gossypium tomentosum]|uniref:Uncharacterized protein n=1 Tax=Gossypium tomentosum TaxID=34277 RepID=A0A5D2M6S0_GOSTO|nr:hypothetical protein ES332_D01G085600v1 [Gossypium tomentosum]